jgi:hypothetical protein
MAYLFLSYSKADKKIAQNIRDLLQQEGGAVWMDENPRELTEEQWPTIEANILRAKAFVLLVSGNAKQSAWLKRELDYAESLNKTIIPILIEGEGWSRLKMPLETLELGLHLALSEALRLRLKRLNLGAASFDLPPQIPAETIHYKRKRAKTSFWLSLIVLSFLALFVFLLVQPIINGMTAEELALHQTEWAIMTRITHTPNASEVMWTQAAIYYGTATQEFIMTLRPGMTEQTATNRAVREESRRTRTQEYVDVEATGTVLSVRRDGAATQTSIRHEQEAILTVTQEYQLNQTAIVGGGTLPCNATVVMENGISSVTLYPGPSLSLGSATLSRTGGEVQQFVLTEWIVNEAGSWYRVGTSSHSSMGYALAEELALDETCPR